MELLAYVDKAHGNLSGPATKRILEREYSEYGQSAYERLAHISVAQIYRFRNSEAYRKRNTSYQPTRPTSIPIGERRKPRPQGRPGFLRIDTVHQGDRDGVKGIYHINAVDEVTQWEIVAATPQISEHWLIPLLEQLLEQFPFVIRGFHSDNGSEFINYTVAKLLDKLLIEQTKSRAHRTGDNGLVETNSWRRWPSWSPWLWRARPWPPVRHPWPSCAAFGFVGLRLGSGGLAQALNALPDAARRGVVALEALHRGHARQAVPDGYQSLRRPASASSASSFRLAEGIERGCGAAAASSGVPCAVMLLSLSIVKTSLSFSLVPRSSRS